MTKENTEYLTTLGVIRAIRDRRATLTNYREGIGILLNYKNNKYYQEGDRFYMLPRGGITKRLVENTQIKPVKNMSDLSGRVIESNKVIDDLTRGDKRTDVSYKSSFIV